ncbi:Uma2 family endonuclease [Corallococcus exiguus]|uniref:Uma2 family endonuclease n=1 Tax=Corallococcus TaxID=83461 RepID=UPI000EE951AD|nr:MULTISPECIES: Uma2 family endonuclease [Corallococcus]NNB85552.1 Uma2 family endonuclease [Corallococcus exiguus]NNB95548.1 Uma2 family endonuclease [Corallococcus exiguus]NNC06370.1 Uma2 family endonuclease [Corallococcus exiguus]NPC49858.1 Uma2 family endonuclease [Corallococcus exiguus]RKH79797.1 Uma2 family endonuclease [Corallococcus sp. AB032C]
MGKKPATYADLEALPDHVVGEIVAGELYASPRPTMRHGTVTHRLGGELLGPFERGRSGPGGWFLMEEPELHLGGDVLVPDVAGWRQERMPAVPETAATSLAPDWVCEVLSPSTRKLDREAKMPVYAREGVRHVWLMDPRTRTLEVFVLRDGRYVALLTHVGDEPVRAEPFGAVELDLAFIWGRTMS